MAYVGEKITHIRPLNLGLAFAVQAAFVTVLAAGLKAPEYQGPPPVTEVSLLKEEKVQLPPPPTPRIEQMQPPFVPAPVFDVPTTLPGNAISATREGDVAPRAQGHGNRQPEYPASAKRLKQQGTVVMLLLVDVDGRVSDARLDESSGFDVLDQAAIREALRSWRYQPGMKQGVVQPVWVRAQVSFRCGVNGCG